MIFVSIHRFLLDFIFFLTYTKTHGHITVSSAKVGFILIFSCIFVCLSVEKGFSGFFEILVFLYFFFYLKKSPKNGQTTHGHTTVPLYIDVSCLSFQTTRVGITHEVLN